MPYKEYSFWEPILAFWKDYYHAIMAYLSLVLGRITFYATVEKRIPTFKQFLVEIVVVSFCGVVWGGLLSYLDVKPGPEYNAVIAVGGFYGAKGVVVLFSYACKKLGIHKKDICSVDDIIKPD